MTGRESLTCLSGGLITGMLGVCMGVRLKSFLVVFRRIGRLHATHTVALVDDVGRTLPIRVDAGSVIRSCLESAALMASATRAKKMALASHRRPNPRAVVVHEAESLDK